MQLPMRPIITTTCALNGVLFNENLYLPVQNKIYDYFNNAFVFYSVQVIYALYYLDNYVIIRLPTQLLLVNADFYVINYIERKSDTHCLCSDILLIEEYNTVYQLLIPSFKQFNLVTKLPNTKLLGRGSNEYVFYQGNDLLFISDDLYVTIHRSVYDIVHIYYYLSKTLAIVYYDYLQIIAEGAVLVRHKFLGRVVRACNNGEILYVAFSDGRIQAIYHSDTILFEIYRYNYLLSENNVIQYYIRDIKARNGIIWVIYNNFMYVHTTKEVIGAMKLENDLGFALNQYNIYFPENSVISTLGDYGCIIYDIQCKIYMNCYLLRALELKKAALFCQLIRFENETFLVYQAGDLYLYNINSLAEPKKIKCKQNIYQCEQFGTYFLCLRTDNELLFVSIALFYIIKSDLVKCRKLCCHPLFIVSYNQDGTIMYYLAYNSEIYCSYYQKFGQFDDLQVDETGLFVATIRYSLIQVFRIVDLALEIYFHCVGSGCIAFYKCNLCHFNYSGGIFLELPGKIIDTYLAFMQEAKRLGLTYNEMWGSYSPPRWQ